MKKQKGMALLEVIVALALLGITGVLFLSGAVNSANARVQADEHATAKVLAESIIDYLKKTTFSSSYDINVPAEYADYGYAAELFITNLSNDFQKLKVTVSHSGRGIYSLETYKADK